jgi:hypothetical protein
MKLDGLPTNISESDILRRNAIIKLLVNWGLCTLEGTGEEYIKSNIPFTKLKVVKYNDKKNWILVPKYHMGVK